MPVLRLELDELTVHAVTEVADLEQIREGILRAMRGYLVSEHRTLAGHLLMLSWRAIGVVDVALVAAEAVSPAPARPALPAHTAG